MSAPEQRPGRNDPCPCGRGAKFKNCCADKLSDNPATQSNSSGRKTALIAVLVGAIAIGAIVWSKRDQPGGTGLSAGGTNGAALPGTATPAPWQFDAVNNRHWDPGHGHWHDGPPPNNRPASGALAQ